MAAKRVILLAILSTAFSPLVVRGADEKKVDYVAEIKPILSARCYACHSALRKKSGLRLDTAALLIAGGDSGPTIQPGDADQSLLVDMITGELGVRMPPEGEGEALSSE